MVNDYEEFALCIGEIDLIICLRISHSQMVGDTCFLCRYDADIDQGKFYAILSCEFAMFKLLKPVFLVINSRLELSLMVCLY